MKQGKDVSRPHEEKLTNRELWQLDENIRANETLLKKLQFYATAATDGNLRALCEEQINLHQKHYQLLLGHVQGRQELH